MYVMFRALAAAPVQLPFVVCALAAAPVLWQVRWGSGLLLDLANFESHGPTLLRQSGYPGGEVHSALRSALCTSPKGRLRTIVLLAMKHQK
jgi:hypothetical protein